MDFIGEFSVSLDVKGRFLLPNDIKKGLQLENATEQVLVLKRGIENCLELITIDAWKKIVENISTKDPFDPAVREFKRVYLGGAQKIVLDSIVRILLSKELIKYAGLEKDIVLASTLTEIEIWDKETYYKKFFENYSAEQFSALAKKVMATKPETI